MYHANQLVSFCFTIFFFYSSILTYFVLPCLREQREKTVQRMYLKSKHGYHFLPLYIKTFANIYHSKCHPQMLLVILCVWYVDVWPVVFPCSFSFWFNNFFSPLIILILALWLNEFSSPLRFSIWKQTENNISRKAAMKLIKMDSR